MQKSFYGFGAGAPNEENPTSGNWDIKDWVSVADDVACLIWPKRCQPVYNTPVPVPQPPNNTALWAIVGLLLVIAIFLIMKK